VGADDAMNRAQACITKYVEEHGACPVTGIPCSLAQVRRIYFTG